MRHFLSVILLIVLVLVAMLSGCGEPQRYDRRLTVADGLMQANPDSALTLVEAVSRDSLPDEGDRAYRDLLLTQARYRCYVTATSDSDINRALAWFRAHPAEREKLTRALIYKGAVMEELSHPDSAMIYYKQAEANADPDDNTNLGQINMRIANLFRLYYGNEQIGFEKYQTALKHYQMTGDKEKQYLCLFNMAMLYGILHNTPENVYLDNAMQAASELHDSLYLYKCIELKCRQLTRNDSTIVEAKQLAMICLSQYSGYVNNHLLLDLASIHAKQGRTDSAKYFLNFINEKNSPGDELIVRTREAEIMNMIAGADNEETPHSISNKACQLSDSILDDEVKYQIERIENEFNEQEAHKKTHRIQNLQQMLWLFAIILLLMTVCFYFLYHYLKKRRRIISYLNELGNTPVDEHTELLESLLNEKDYAIAQFVNRMVEFLKTYAESEQQDNPSTFARKIKCNIQDASDNTFWNELKNYLDKKHNDIITRIATYPGVSESDLRLVSLMCCGFSYIEIAIIMGYTRKYISNKRRYIAKKMGLDIPLQDYLEKETNKHLF